MISLRIHTLAAAFAGAASLLAGTAHAGGHPCATAADCAGSYRPASAAYAFAPPGPAYANAGYAQQAARPAGYVGYDRASLGPAYAGGAYAAQGYASQGYATQGYAAQGGYAAYQAGYATGAAYPVPAPSPCASACAPPPPPPAPDCGTVCVPAYQVVELPPQEVALAGDFYTGGVGVTEFQGGGGGGFNGNFEVSGFGDVSAFASAHAAAWANADAYAKSMAYAQANAKAYANANAQTNVNIKLNASFNNKVNFHGNGGCNTCKPQPVHCDTCSKPQPVSCNTCGGVGGGSWGGGKMGMGMAPSPRGGWMGRRH